MKALNISKFAFLFLSIVLVAGTVLARTTEFKALEVFEFQAFYGSLFGFASVLINSYTGAHKRKKM